jgi:hypothetical protein
VRHATLPGGQFFTNPFKDQDVGVHRHSMLRTRPAMPGKVTVDSANTSPQRDDDVQQKGKVRDGASKEVKKIMNAATAIVPNRGINTTPDRVFAQKARPPLFSNSALPAVFQRWPARKLLSK